MKCNYNGCSRKCKGDVDVESCNVLRAYQQGTRDFAEWLQEKSVDNTITLNYGKFKNRDIDDVIDEWQKGKGK